MKRQWGFDHIITKKTKKRASSDVGLIFIAYNMRRLINIIGKANLGAYLKSCMSLFLTELIALRTKISNYRAIDIFNRILNYLFTNEQKGLYLLKI